MPACMNYTCHPSLSDCIFLFFLFFAASLSNSLRDEAAVATVHSGRKWRGAEVEPDRGAGPGDAMLRLPQNRQGAQEGERRLRVPQNLWELPPQWSLWDKVRCRCHNCKIYCEIRIKGTINSFNGTIYKVDVLKHPYHFFQNPLVLIKTFETAALCDGYRQPNTPPPHHCPQPTSQHRYPGWRGWGNLWEHKDRGHGPRQGVHRHLQPAPLHQLPDRDPRLQPPDRIQPLQHGGIRQRPHYAWRWAHLLRFFFF